jgi:hypothetical protein
LDEEDLLQIEFRPKHFNLSTIPIDSILKQSILQGSAVSAIHGSWLFQARPKQDPSWKQFNRIFGRKKIILAG